MNLEFTYMFGPIKNCYMLLSELFLNITITVIISKNASRTGIFSYTVIIQFPFLDNLTGNSSNCVT